MIGMNYRLRIALTIIFTSILASVAFGQESIKLHPLEFSWSHPALQGYKSDECYFIPPVGSDRVFLACSFYQTIHANALRSCLEFGQSSEIPEEKCIPSGLWVGQLNASRTGFEKEWFVAWQVLAKYGVDKFLGSDAQGNLWAVKQGYLPDESTSLLMASTSQKELVFNVVADFGSQILSVVLRPNKEIMVLAGDKLHKLINN